MQLSLPAVPIRCAQCQADLASFRIQLALQRGMKTLSGTCDNGHEVFCEWKLLEPMPVLAPLKPANQSE